MPRNPMLICGGGIAGLTLAIRLKEQGEQPIVVERKPEPDSGGHMIDFYATGWDVAGRLGIAERLRRAHYPIERVEYVDDKGSAFISVPIERIRDVFDGRFAYLRRGDLSEALRERANELRVEFRYGCEVRSVVQDPTSARVELSDGTSIACEAVFGADGLHSQIRNLVFGSESQVSHYLGCYIATFEAPCAGTSAGHAVRRHEGPDTLAIYYPISHHAMDVVVFFRAADIGTIALSRRASLLKERCRQNGWITPAALDSLADGAPIVLEPMMQIKMDIWHRNRTALLGDACCCMSPLAGEDAQLSMAAGYVLGNEIRKSPRDLRTAFERYEEVLHPVVERRQAAVALVMGTLVPGKEAGSPMRRLQLKSRYSAPLLRKSLGGISHSLLEHYA